MVRQDVEASRLPLLLRKLKDLGYGQDIYLDTRHAPLIGHLVDDLLSTGEGCRNLQQHTEKQNAEVQHAIEEVEHDRCL